MKWYSLWVTKMPRPPGDAPYPQAYGDSWWHVADISTTHAHMIQMATCLKMYAREYWGVRVFEGKGHGKMIWQWAIHEKIT